MIWTKKILCHHCISALYWMQPTSFCCSLMLLTYGKRYVWVLFKKVLDWLHKKQCGQGRVVPVHTCSGCIGVAPLIFHLSTRWRWVVISCPICFTCRKAHQCPFSRRLGGTQSWSGQFWRKNNFLLLLKFKPQTIPPVASHPGYAIPTTKHSI